MSGRGITWCKDGSCGAPPAPQLWEQGLWRGLGGVGDQLRGSVRSAFPQLSSLGPWFLASRRLSLSAFSRAFL